MNREVHVRFCEGLGVQFPGPTRHSKFLGRNRNPNQVEGKPLFWLRADERASMNPVAKVLWFIENHFTEDLTLDDVANAGGVSRYHMSRVFGIATGVRSFAMCVAAG